MRRINIEGIYMKHCLDFRAILSFYDYVILVATYKNLETKQQTPPLVLVSDQQVAHCKAF
jgi:hypothetical protein